MSGTLDRITVEDDGDDEGAQSETEEAFDEESDDEEDSADPAALAEDAAATVSQRMVGSVNAWALRSAIKWTPSLNSDISFSLGYAVGSGTRANARAGSETFLQPGLYSNELDDHYYGEVLEPELSNLQIVSLRLSGTVFESTQFRLTHQRYFRDTKEDETLETELDLELSGEGRSLGHETSLAFDIELTEDLSSEVTLARFTPGSAIDSETRKPITFLALELAYEF